MRANLSLSSWALDLRECLLAIALLAPGTLGQSWYEVAKIAPKPGDVGQAVALDGDTAVVGAPGLANLNGAEGAAFIHERDLGGKGTWGKRTKLLGPMTLGSADFGCAVAISGDLVVVGAKNQAVVGPAQGAAFVFQRNLGGPDEWGQVGMLVASDGTGAERFGFSLDVWGDTAVVGTYLDDELGYGAGAAYVYQRDQGGPGSWGEVTKLTASDGYAGDAFGLCAIHEDIIVVGATNHSSVKGAVYVFERDAGGSNAWGEMAKVMASDGVSGDSFGTLTLWEDTLVVGAVRHDGIASESGAAYVFRRGSTSAIWNEQMKLLPSSGNPVNWFGVTLSLHGRTLAVGTLTAGQFDGAAFRFENDPAGPVPWVETQKLVSPGSTSFGEAVATGPREVIVGDPRAVIGGWAAGAAYIYEDWSGVTYCTAGTSASGCRATLKALGTPSATEATGFFLDASDVEGDSKGLFFFGANGRQANSWGNGTSFQCVVPPVKRGGVLPAVGKAGACDGTFLQDLNARWCPTCPKAHHNPGAGAITQAQLWYRDRNSTSNQTTSLSDAIEFVLGP